MSFGDKLKQLRKQNGYSQKELADRIGVEDRTIRNWEKGETKPGIEESSKIARILNCDVSYLIDDPTTIEKQAEKIKQDITTMFSGGEMAEVDMDTLMLAIQEAYIDAKRRQRQIDS